MAVDEGRQSSASVVAAPDSSRSPASTSASRCSVESSGFGFLLFRVAGSSDGNSIPTEYCSDGLLKRTSASPCSGPKKAARRWSSASDCEGVSAIWDHPFSNERLEFLLI